mmetsp:Transcript_7616/g.17514  ORF Transcript_7616/g.17514 Transcript_7616/m.17514 type:complete len:215 (+) Transcript_7616:334-978(+)
MRYSFELALCTASLPSQASSVSNPACCSARHTMRRFNGTSSTTRTRLDSIRGGEGGRGGSVRGGAMDGVPSGFHEEQGVCGRLEALEAHDPGDGQAAGDTIAAEQKFSQSAASEGPGRTGGEAGGLWPSWRGRGATCPFPLRSICCRGGGGLRRARGGIGERSERSDPSADERLERLASSGGGTALESVNSRSVSWREAAESRPLADDSAESAV